MLVENHDQRQDKVQNQGQGQDHCRLSLRCAWWRHERIGIADEALCVAQHWHGHVQVCAANGTLPQVQLSPCPDGFTCAALPTWAAADALGVSNTTSDFDGACPVPACLPACLAGWVPRLWIC